jgi:7-cyano-7-deazaguanine synthase in queuosine biosynthesis
MRTSISISGGLDSTYALWKLLTETNDSIEAVYIDMKNISIDQAASLRISGFSRRISKKETELRFERLEKIVEWCNKNIRPFTFVKHAYDPSLIDSNYLNVPPVYFVGLYINKINKNLHDKVVISHEQENDGFCRFESDNNRNSGSMEAKRRFIDQATRGEINFMLLDMNYHQGYAFKELPQELIDYTRSCDEPESHTKECGTCFKCSKRKFFKQKIDNNESLTNIWNYVQRKSVKDNNKWLSMKSWLVDDVSTYENFIVAGSNHIPEKIERDMPEWPTSHKIS